MSDYFFANYFYVLNVLGAIVATTMFVGALDDLFIDVYYWSYETYRKLFIRSKYPRLRVEQLMAKPQSYFAVMAPAWKEYDVIAGMIENTLATMNYDKFVIFAGVYQNDAETAAEVDRMVRKYPDRVCRATVLNDGPTCKADCLNWIAQRIFQYEQDHRIEFSGLVLHDSEDVIHPLEFRLFNYLIEKKDLIQLPVLSLPRKWYEFIGESYADDFAEWCQKEMVVRESLTGVVPGCGVATCYARHAVKALSERLEGVPFNTSTLTEDYDLSFRLSAMGYRRQIFVRFPVLETVQHKNFWTGKLETRQVKTLIAVREYFPNGFRAAYRQRARWILGVAFQGWQQLGWKGSLSRKYLFFRDRKSVVSAFVGWMAYLLVLNVLILYLIQWAGVDFVRFPELALPESWIYEVVLLNFWLFINRIVHRIFFVWRLEGFHGAIRVLPHMIIGNIVNFFAICRAWKLFASHLITGKKIGWDKTAHRYLEGELKLHRLLGDMLDLSAEKIAQALQIQARTAQPFGHICLRQGWISADQLADALSEQANYLRGDLSLAAVRKFANELPVTSIIKHKIIPFAFGQTGALHLAVTSLRTEETLRAISSLAGGKQVLCFVVPDEQFSSALQLIEALGQAQHDAALKLENA